MNPKACIAYILSQDDAHDWNHVDSTTAPIDNNPAAMAPPSPGSSPTMPTIGCALEPLPIDPTKSSRYCMMPGCGRRAKRLRRCWSHGGAMKCTVIDCPNLSKSHGKCWTHGGGIACCEPHCHRIAISHGLCWTHGGGKRCKLLGCTKAATFKTEGFCTFHYRENSWE